jgi:4-amino-4-deoxy-L-arabinose transferase-like glycosyltransferase
MAVTGDFVTPRLDGVKYFEKPPLVYWLSAVTFRAFGVNEFTARLWNGLFSALGVLLTYAAARALYDRATGIGSAVVLSTFLIYFALSQIVLLDMAVAVTISGALLAFIVAMQEPAGKKRFALFMAFYVFMALATLSKGLIGIALPGAVLFFWVLLLNRWRALWPFYPITGTLLLLAIAAVKSAVAKMLRELLAPVRLAFGVVAAVAGLALWLKGSFTNLLGTLTNGGASVRGGCIAHTHTHAHAHAHVGTILTLAVMGVRQQISTRIGTRQPSSKQQQQRKQRREDYNEE